MNEPNSSILGYQGNAALGGGLPGVGTPTGLGADSLNGLNNTLENIAAQNYQTNIANWHQKIRDRDEVMKAVAENQIDVPVLDQDRPVLEKELNDIKEAYLKTPNLKSNPAAWADMQSKIKSFTDKKNLAKIRQVEVTKMLQDYANNPDERYRKTLGSHIDTEVGKGITHVPQPYQKLQDWSDGLFGETTQTTVDKANGKQTVVKTSLFSPKELPGSNKPVQQNGLYYKQKTVGSDLSDWDRFYSPANFVEGENKNLPDQASAFYKFALQDKNLMSDDTLNAINGKLDSINQQNNLTPDNPRYLHPIAQKNADGTWDVVQDPIYFSKAISLYKNYQEPKTTLEPSKDLQTMASTKAQETQRYASATAQRALAGKYSQEAKLAEQKGDKLVAETAILKGQGSSAASESVDFFNKASDASGYKDVGDLLGEAGKPIAAQLKQQLNINPNDKAIPLAKSDKTVQKIFAKPDYDRDGKYKGTKTYPVAVYAIKNTDGDVTMVGLYKDGTFKNSDVYGAAGEIIKHDSGYRLNDKTIKLQDASRQVIDDIKGLQNPEAVNPVKAKIDEGHYDGTVEDDGNTYYIIDGKYFNEDGEEIH